jgi:hypothetical protein
VRPYTPSSGQRPTWHTSDHRYGRPDWRYVGRSPHASAPPPTYQSYRSYYTRWWCHPYYRYQYATTVVVYFDFDVYPHQPYWRPPYRDGWVWVDGYYTSYGYWVPGRWRPTTPAPRYGYVWANGGWDGGAYVDGYWRPESRSGWEWVEGYYLEDGTWVWGYWRPTTAGPRGYVWEPGFFDGESYVDGFWRPEFRPGYTWVSAFYDQDGVYHGGYWAPIEDEPGFDWVPGWFDGNDWIEGYWVPVDEAQSSLDTWRPDDGWNAGWGTEDDLMLYVDDPDDFPVDDGEGGSPLAIPVR